MAHALEVLSFATSAYGCWILRDSGLSLYLTVYQIRMDAWHYRAITVAFATVALAHLNLLHMISMSVR